MTPKHHALLSSIAATKDAAADEFQALMLKAVRARMVRSMLEPVFGRWRCCVCGS